jgi:spermidine/putrescine transport system ATP-binding protein
MENNGSFLKLTNIHKGFGASLACAGIDLTVKAQEFFFILGPSGCGKSTLLRLIAGLAPLDNGSIYLKGDRLDTLPPYRRPVHMVFQNYALFPHLTVFENVAFALKMKNTPRMEIEKRVPEALELVKLRGFDQRKPSELSGGQQQRVALARALINQPPVLLLDESLGALDVKLRKEMQLELKQLQQNLGTTFIYVTHDQEEALTIGDRIAIMNQANIEQVGTPEEIYNHPKTRFVAEFIGEANFFDSFSKIEEKGKTLRFYFQDRLWLSGLKPSEFTSASDLKTFQLAVRPERIKLHSKAPRPQEGLNQISGTLKASFYRGASCQYLIQIGDHFVLKALESNDSDRSSFHIGETVFATWPEEASMVLNHSQRPKEPVVL